MDFRTVLENLLQRFKKSKVRYALMGGFAMGAWGVPRATVDLDFLVHKDDVEKVHRIMTHLGYDCRYKTENVSQYLSPLNIFGEVDFLHAFREVSLRMLQRAEERDILDGITVKVLEPEDLIGFKLQAIANDESRRNIHLADIESLIEKFKDRLDWSLIEDYFKLFAFEGLLRELKGKYGIA